MAQIINSNILSLTTQRNLNRSQNDISTAVQRLSSGLRINSAKDDAAGLAISDRFTAQIRGLNQAARNANDGISFAQTAEGALTNVGDSLQRMRELAVQSINDTNSGLDRQSLNNEVAQLIGEINRIANTTQFNGQNILDGSLTTATFQIGANQNQTISVSGVDFRGQNVGANVTETASITQTNLDAAIAAADMVINGTGVDVSGLAAGATIDQLITEINNIFNSTGVAAQKAASTSTGDLTYAAPAAASTVTINGMDIAIGAGAADQGVVDSINAATAQTGVTATLTAANTIELSNNDGSAIELVDAGGVLGGDETFYAGIVFSTDVGSAPTLAGAFDDVTGAAATLDLQTSTDEVLNNVNILTATDANAAIRTIDFALQQVSNLRSEFGAVQNRFEATVANLQVGAETLSASRSRILDADFAAETAKFTRAQILQQAGVAMVAQANALPQSVLSLLG